MSGHAPDDEAKGGEPIQIHPKSATQREYRVSFALPNDSPQRAGHTPHRHAAPPYNLSLTLSQHSLGSGSGFAPASGGQRPLNQLVTPRSPLYPANIIPYKDRVTSPLTATEGGASHESPEQQGIPRKGAEKDGDPRSGQPAPSPQVIDPANGAILIYPKKVDNLSRFRTLFIGLLLFVSASTQGMHSLFGVLYLQAVYHFTVREMAVVYLCGTAFGLFTLPFGLLYDWFGPRVVVAVTSAIAALGHLLYALMFAGHIGHSVAHCAVFYALMCWGCYGITVAVLPAVLTHMPRDRGQPTGMLQTFSGLGSSLFSCLFRGFFNGDYAALMWFLFAVTVVVGVIGTIFLEDAPYIVNRWQQRHIRPRAQLRSYLIRNRYMAQLVPQRRYLFMTLVLILLNFYLTIQAVVVAYLAKEMTPGKQRGIAIGAIAIITLTLILVVPSNAIDGPTEQDKQVIEDAKSKEEQLRDMQEERYRQRHRAKKGKRGDHPGEEVECAGGNDQPRDAIDDAAPAAGEGGAASDVDVQSEHLSPVEVFMDEERSHTLPASANRNDHTSTTVRLPLFVPVDGERPLLSVYVYDEEEENEHSGRAVEVVDGGRDAGPESGARQQPHSASARHHDSPSAHNRTHSLTVRLELEALSSMRTAHTSPGDSRQIELTHTRPSTYTNPRVETITLCGEVFVAPVYQTTFLESLTYLDLWMIAYTTLCVWGVGLTMTGNWDIYVMLLARYAGMEQKHYILFAAMAGVSTAGGRVFLGVYERVLRVIRTRTGVAVVPTIIYPVTSIGMLIGVVLWIALPGDKVLVLAYLIGPAFYGISTSVTPYVLGTIFDRDLGTHYGFCFFAGSIGFVLCYWCSWFLTYEREASPLMRGYCIGHRRCMNRAVGIYVALIFSSVFSSLVVHRRYAKLVRGRLAQRRVIVPRVMKLFSCFRGGAGHGDVAHAAGDGGKEKNNDGVQPPTEEARNPLVS